MAGEGGAAAVAVNWDNNTSMARRSADTVSTRSSVTVRGLADAACSDLIEFFTYLRQTNRGRQHY